MKLPDDTPGSHDMKVGDRIRVRVGLLVDVTKLTDEPRRVAAARKAAKWAMERLLWDAGTGGLAYVDGMDCQWIEEQEFT